MSSLSDLIKKQQSIQPFKKSTSLSGLTLGALIKQQKPVTDAGVDAAKAIMSLNDTLNQFEKPFHIPAEEIKITEVRFATAPEYPSTLPEHLKEIQDAVNEQEETTHQHVFDAEQDAAVKGLLNEKYCCLVGAAGTGKTYTLKRYLKELRNNLQAMAVARTGQETTTSLNIVFCSFIGRAVQQMRKVLPGEYHANCGTIHGDRVLAYAPEYVDVIDDNGVPRTRMRFVPTFHSGNKMGYKYVVIDECGMLSTELWNTLYDAMRPETEVKMIGDINQLPPVYGRSVLGFAMLTWPTFELKTPHRAALDNPITYNAHRILNGQKPQEMKNEHGEFIMVNIGHVGSQAAQEKLINLVKYAHTKDKFDSATDTIIVPVNKGPIGQLELNATLVNYFNSGSSRVFIRTGAGSAVFGVGDKVMMLANDKASNLTNGQIGVIKSITLNGAYQSKGGNVAALRTNDLKIEIADDHEFNLQTAIDEQADADAEYSREAATERAQRQASHIVSVQFEGLDTEVDFSTAGQFSKLAHGYTITCHKSQGGEYPTVIMLCHSAHKTLLSREWLYTADTRGRIRVILVYNDAGLRYALGTQRIKGTTLQEKILSFQELSTNIIGDVVEVGPNLPAPEKSQIAKNSILVG